MKTTRTLLLTALFLVFAGMGSAVDDIQAVGALWNDFVAALRRGDYRAAHALFSEQSREALPYVAFVREYGPLSAARELVLLRPEGQSTRLEEDWAEISSAGTRPGTGQVIRIGAAAVKNHGVWGLVAARNETRERLEALARGVLRRAGRLRGDPAARRTLEDWAVREAGNSPVFRAYHFETDGMQFRALPRERGLRAFHLDDWGMVQSGAAASIPANPPAAALTQQAQQAQRSQQSLSQSQAQLQPQQQPPETTLYPLVNGLPELTEPLFPPPLPFAPEEMPEPFASSAASSTASPEGKGNSGGTMEKNAREVAPVELPDLIGF